MKKEFCVHNLHKEPLYGDIRFSSSSGGAPVILFIHGFMGFKDWGSAPYVAEQFSRNGFCAVTFNYSRNGVAGHGNEYSAPEAFARNTISRELDDLTTMTEAIRLRTIAGLENVNSDEIFLLGFSRGGGEAIVFASEQPGFLAVSAWGALANFDRWTARQKRRWREAGEMIVLKESNGKGLRMLPSFLDDLTANAARFDILRAASRLRSPLLLIHGEEDMTVSIAEARMIAAACDPHTSMLEIIPHTGHLFGASHPFGAPTAALNIAIAKTTDFFKEVLRRQRSS